MTAASGSNVDKASRLRELHKAPPILVLPNAWDAATARVFEAAGFPAVATTSAGVANALGYPDGGAVSMTEMIEAIGRIARAVDVPLSADIEHAYATVPQDVAKVVQRVIAAGAVGINIEDFVPGADALEPIELQCDKIAAVKSAAPLGVAVVINARTDVFLRRLHEPASRLDIAVARGRAYLQAGADCVFVPGVTDSPTIQALVRGIGGPINVLAVAGTPPVSELEALGVARVSVGSGPSRAALALVRDIADELRTRGTYSSFTDHAMPPNEANGLMRTRSG